MSIPLATAPSPAEVRDPLLTLRAYHALAPWSLRDLAGLAATILEVSGIVPVNVAARARPSERTIRFYVMRNLVDPPEGRGTAAVYRYRHLLQVLAIKLRQMEGLSLAALAREFEGTTGDVLERRVASALGARLPDPTELGAVDRVPPVRPRAARVRDLGPDATGRSLLLRRISLEPGAELILEAGHPLFRHAGAEEAIAVAVADALSALADDLGTDR